MTHLGTSCCPWRRQPLLKRSPVNLARCQKKVFHLEVVDTMVAYIKIESASGSDTRQAAPESRAFCSVASTWSKVSPAASSKRAP